MSLETIKILQLKIDELKKISLESGVDFNSEIAKLQSKIDAYQVDTYKHLTAWEKVTLARKQDRPTAAEYIDVMIDDFIELHGDRNFRDDEAIIGGVGFLGNMPVTIIAQQRGRSTKENIQRNFGMAHPEGYRKALRLMKQAEKFNRPVLCLVDTKGAFCGLGAEERGEGEAIARNLFEMSGLKVPIISVIIGEGGSGGALAVAVSDQVWMLENAIYSILSPEGFASILWKDSKRAKEAAEIMKITAHELKEFGIIEKVISEPMEGIREMFEATATTLKEALIEAFKSLKAQEKETMVEARYQRYRAFGDGSNN